MAKTPLKNVELTTVNFVPKEISSPSKDFSGISRTVFTRVSNIHGLIGDWIRVQGKGDKVCKTISALKLHECEDDYYPQQLKTLMNTLLEALDGLGQVVEGISTINNQMQALAKLQATDQPVISTWSVKQISHCVSDINSSLLKEHRLKKVITENIAHCRDENLIEVYVSGWEYNVYLNLNDCAYLFAEVSLPVVQ